VRSQAAEWAISHPWPRAVDGLIHMLGDPAALCRFIAKDSLLRMGDRVVEPLREYLAAAVEENTLENGLEVAVGLADPRLFPIARERMADARPAIRTHACRLLAAIGGEQATRLLVAALDDPAAEVRTCAADGLGRLGYWAAGTDLARLLRDPSWDVRRAAALSLRGFGSAGEILLRRALSDPDRFAADMARQTLDLPSAALGARPSRG